MLACCLMPQEQEAWGILPSLENESLVENLSHLLLGFELLNKPTRIIDVHNTYD